MQTNADKLRISEGFVVWIVGTAVEETALLDPMPEGARMIAVPDADDPDTVDAAILFADDRTQLAESFDEVLPQLGPIPVVWVSYPVGDHIDIDEEAIQEQIADSGWFAVESVALNETWAALRIEQS